jgi:hypothetical protein
MIDVPYPVISQVPLDSHRWRIWLGRGAGALARQYPGTILVFQIRDRFVVGTSATAMYGKPAGASAVAVVSLERQRIAVTVLLPSRWSQTCVGIVAEYECQVVDAGLLLQSGYQDVRPVLQGYLAADAKIRMLAAQADLWDFAPFQLRITAHVIARSRISPPFIPGMVCGLTHLEIEPRHWPPPTGSTPAIGEANGSEVAGGELSGGELSGGGVNSGGVNGGIGNGGIGNGSGVTGGGVNGGNGAKATDVNGGQDGRPPDSQDYWEW